MQSKTKFCSIFVSLILLSCIFSLNAVAQSQQIANQNPIPPNYLAWEMVTTAISPHEDYASAIVVNDNDELIIAGTFRDELTINVCTAEGDQAQGHLGLYVAKLDSNGTCIWISTISKVNNNIHSIDNGIALDSEGGIYVTGATGSGTVSVILNSSNSSSQATIGGTQGSTFIAKISNDGDWEWVYSHGQYYSGEVAAIDIDSNDNIRIGSVYSSGSGVYSDIIHLNKSGSIISQTNLGGNSGNLGFVIGDISSSSDGIYVVGSFMRTVSFEINGISESFTSPTFGLYFPFALMLEHNGDVRWFANISSSTGSGNGRTNFVVSDGTYTYITGRSYSDLQFGNYSYSSGGTQNGFLASLDQNGNWNWVKQLECSATLDSNSIALDSAGDVYVAGTHNGCNINLGGMTLNPSAGQYDAFIAKVNQTGWSTWASSAGTTSNDEINSITIDSNNNLFIAGYQENQGNYGLISSSWSGDKDSLVGKLSSDYDNDGAADVNDDDIDGDYLLNYQDLCVYSFVGFQSTRSNDHDADGCEDNLEDNDDDNDQLNDTLDNCPKGMTDWIRTNESDLDNDGCMDALEDFDDDNDGFEDYEDYCSRIPGNSTFEFEKGCPDADGDGRPDVLDPFKNDPTEWSDMDGDEVGDNSDAFPLDATQQYDTDGDTYGDEKFGNAGDSCPTVYGTSTIDRYGCLDTDGDGWSDEGDDFPNDPTEHLDTDGDEVPDHADDFPFDATQQTDTDGDGYGDNANGNLGDAFPNDASRYADSDRDGIDDNTDAFPYDPTQWEDADGDGMGDNPMGIGADKFPNDPTQWGDIDGDGYGDNITGNNPDAFPTDATQWSDIDGDGYGDNPAGRLYDLFPENPTQWEDDDGDGLGDNQSGTDADPYLNDFDNDGYNDTIDILPRLSSPGDLDNDGCLDEDDAFIDNALECLDTDGDGTGNNADADDDGDGWTDADESRAATNPLDANDKPVDSFEIQIGNIGLSAWDLVGIFAGAPIFGWIVFGFITRNARCARYEEQLSNAESRSDLEKVALRWEYSLMLRLLGPHQGIRLERLRSELDDKFENAELLIKSAYSEPLTEVDQTQIVESGGKDVPEIASGPSKGHEGTIDSDGYHWLEYSGVQYYRSSSQEEWIEWSN